MFKSFYKCKKNSYRNKIHLCTPLPLSNALWKYVEVKIVESIIARLKSGKQTRSRLHSPYYRYLRHVLRCKKHIVSYVRASCFYWTYLRLFSWRSLLLSTFQHWGKDYNDMSATLRQSTEVTKWGTSEIQNHPTSNCVCLQYPNTTFYIFIPILIFKFQLFLRFPRERFSRQFHRNNYVQISFLQHDSQFFIFTNVCSCIMEPGNIQITGYGLLFKY